jgi:hypothetical protein
MLRSVLTVVLVGSIMGSVPAFAQIDCGNACLRLCAQHEPVPGYDNGNCNIGCMHGCYWYLSEHHGQLPAPAAARHRKPAASSRQ